MKINKKKIYIFIIFIFLVILTILLLINNHKNNNNSNKLSNSLTLFGLENITLNYNEKYQEPGYYALTSDGTIDSKNVIVTGEVITDTPGTYTITYQYKDIVKKRTITILEKTLDDNLYIELIGESVITLEINDTYYEEGVKAYINDIDLSKDVIIDSNLDTTKVGTYTINYKIIYNNEIKEIERNIIVVDNSLKIKLNISNTSYTNSSIDIKITIIGNSFDYLLLPNNIIIKDKNSTFNISENKSYTFKAYNKEGKEFKETINISNIDKEKPTGSCNAILNIKSTVITTNISDNLSGIKNYIYKNNNTELLTTQLNSYNHNKKLSKKISVIAFDNAGNSSNITCDIVDNSFLPVIKPLVTDNIIKQEETDTLKVYITKQNSYYITRIWAYDPYNQLNKEDSSEYGKNLYKPKTLLENAINKNKLQNKLIIGFNASGFYLKDTYDQESVKKYSKYDKTSVGTIVITNGKLIRNTYDKAYKTWYTIGIDDNYDLKIFTDKKASSVDEINEKKVWSNMVINSGIRNTFTFASPLVENYKASTITTSMPSISSKLNRQAICQINSNNFILITGKNLNRNDLINIMLNLNCKTGTNLDGGGSIALLYKSSNKDIETIIGNSRSLTEVGYFTE